METYCGKKCVLFIEGKSTFSVETLANSCVQNRQVFFKWSLQFGGVFIQSFVIKFVFLQLIWFLPEKTPQLTATI